MADEAYKELNHLDVFLTPAATTSIRFSRPIVEGFHPQARPARPVQREAEDRVAMEKPCPSRKI